MCQLTQWGTAFHNDFIYQTITLHGLVSYNFICQLFLKKVERGEKRWHKKRKTGWSWLTQELFPNDSFGVTVSWHGCQVNNEEWRLISQNESKTEYLQGKPHPYPPKIRSDQSLSCVWLFATPWIAARQASLSITNSRSSLHGVGGAIQPSHPLSSPSPPAPNPSQHQSLFQWVNSSHEVAKVLEFQL